MPIRNEYSPTFPSTWFSLLSSARNPSAAAAVAAGETGWLWFYFLHFSSVPLFSRFLMALTRQTWVKYLRNVNQPDKERKNQSKFCQYINWEPIKPTKTQRKYI